MKPIMATLVLALLIAGVTCTQPGDEQLGDEPAIITWPTEGTCTNSTSLVISGKTLSGADGFESYEVLFAHGTGSDVSWEGVYQGTSPVTVEGPLATWNTIGLPDGAYSLKLTVWAIDGHRYDYIAGPIVIDTEAPTVTWLYLHTTSLALQEQFESFDELYGELVDANFEEGGLMIGLRDAGTTGIWDSIAKIYSSYPGDRVLTIVCLPSCSDPNVKVGFSEAFESPLSPWMTVDPGTYTLRLWAKDKAGQTTIDDRTYVTAVPPGI